MRYLALLALLFVSEPSEATLRSIRYPSSSFGFYFQQTVSVVPKLAGFEGLSSPGCVSNTLPYGLRVDSRTCAITGTVQQYPVPGQGPLEAVIQSRYLPPIRLFFTVLTPEVRYPATGFELFFGQEANIVPALIGFQPGQYPGCWANNLPPGLQLDPMTCAITGNVWHMPYPNQPPYIVTVYAGPAAPVTLSFNVMAQEVRYPSNVFDVFPNQQISIVPVLVGFQPGQYPGCWSNTLPPGLQLDPMTCAISGWIWGPSYPGQPPFQATIYAGPVQPILLTFNVRAYEIRYPVSELEVFQGQSVELVPELVGFQPGQYPGCWANNLPPGLQLDPMTCAITGQVWMQGYPDQPPITVTIQAGMASTTVTFRIRAQEVRYPARQFTLRSGEWVSIVPELVGLQPGQVWCSASYLPNGLWLDSWSCAINGTPWGYPGETVVTTIWAGPTAPTELTFTFE
ncbi:MAG TPA: hypothetical protein VM598_13585 [Bdellovibrionota bacterium]|nr:hypothetical protein [Bdellovibrionota bacterium]